MAAELPRPGVEVIQVFRAVSPTVITPTLVPCVVGVAKQIVDVLVPNGTGGNSLNAQALITLPGFFLAKVAPGGPPLYTGLDTLSLVFSVNNGPAITVIFSDPTAAGLSPATVVDQVRRALADAGVTSVAAETVGSTQWRLRTVGVGEFQTIFITAATSAVVATTFGIGIGKTYAGIGLYNQFIVDVPQTNFPDPRHNLAELGIDPDSIRVFLATGNSTGLREASRTSAFDRRGEIDDPAYILGTVDINVATVPAYYGGGGTLDTTTLVVSVDGGPLQVVTFVAPASQAAVVSQINAGTVGLTAALVGAGPPSFLTLTSDSTGASASIRIDGASTSIAFLGLLAATYVGFSIEATDDGSGDLLTPLIRFDGLFPEVFTTTPTAAVITGSGGTFPIIVGGSLLLSDGQQPQTITITPGMSLAAVVAAINAVVGLAAGGFITASSFGGELRLTHSKTGTDSLIDIIGGSVVAELGHVVGITRGIASKPEPGDELWIDGSFFGNIVQVAPGGATDTLKIDRQVSISLNVGTNFYIIAKNLPGVASRPSPELIIDLNGDVKVKQEILRDTTGFPSYTLRAPIYLAYTAVRKDVSALAAQPGLLRLDDTVQLEDTLSPISTANPLALGLFFALLNAPGIQVTGLGVDAVSDDAPFGTVEAFTRAAEYLEGFEVYAIAPLTHDQTVGQVFKTHVDVMSQPGNKGERITLWNPSRPTTKLDTLVASNTNGNSSSPLSFDTGVTNLSALVLNAGINPVGTIPVSAGLFLDIASDAKNYSIASISGSIVTIRIVFAAGENDDGFYSTTDLNDPPLPSVLIEEAFSIKVRGAPLTTVSNQPDKQGIAETFAALGQTFGDRRFWMTLPDRAAATLEGLETLIDGFYLNAGIVGMIGQQPPQQSFTNFPMTGYTRVIGSNDFFNERQLNIMAAGGSYIIVQDAQGAPLISRFALTTDLTSIETRTDSITKVVDFSAKFLRRGLKNFIGRFNITQGFLDSLGSVIQGLLGFLVETGVLIGANLNNIIQDEDAPDTVLVDVTLDVPFPCNFIRLTLVI